MNKKDIICMAIEAELNLYVNHLTEEQYIEVIERFAKLVAEAERKECQGRIDTLHAMYELASKQRDALMDEQRAQVAAMRGRIQ